MIVWALFHTDNTNWRQLEENCLITISDIANIIESVITISDIANIIESVITISDTANIIESVH